jgi:DNA repair protein RecN (Recombination protein N)
MLNEIFIRNFAIIDEIRVSFGDGLNVISGETGTGKSIIIGAVSLLLGDRASADMIRSSEDAAVVEACFNVAGMEVLQNRLKEMEMDNGDELIIRRTVSRSGKNRVYINGSMASLASLSSIIESLINICGQHEHQLILNRENHIDILDAFGGLQSLRDEYGELYERYNFLKAKLRELEAASARIKAEEELYRFQSGEITNAGISPGEDESLLEEKKVISHAQKLLELADAADDRLYGKTDSVLEELRAVMANLREIKNIDRGLKIEERDVETIYYQLEDISATIRKYAKNLSFDQQRLDVVEERLEFLGRMKRKYGGTLEAVLKRQSELENALKNIATIDGDVEQTIKSMELCRKQLKEKADRLAENRRDAGERLKGAIEKEIHTLKMARASFDVFFKPFREGEEDVFRAKGTDDVEFYLSTNAGEELKPLARIASGGELSRIVLAIRKVLAGTGPLGTIIFDEVDSGIGGATAEIVGEKLREVARNYQVLCITHLPQIACFADRHYLVAKEERDERTSTSIRFLSEDERLDEITRMLAGVEKTEKAREHAREMLKASRGHLVGRN